MSTKVYLIHCSHGGYEDYRQVDICCAPDAKTAAAYVEKFSCLVRKLDEANDKVRIAMEHWEVDNPMPNRYIAAKKGEWSAKYKIKHKEVKNAHIAFTSEDQLLIDTFNLSDYLKYSDAEFGWCEIDMIDALKTE